jgi:hypothetical protein
MPPFRSPAAQQHPWPNFKQGALAGALLMDRTLRDAYPLTSCRK